MPTPHLTECRARIDVEDAGTQGLKVFGSSVPRMTFGFKPTSERSFDDIRQYQIGCYRAVVVVCTNSSWNRQQG